MVLSWVYFLYDIGSGNSSNSDFYRHLEIDMGKSIRGFKSVLAWIHLVGMNVGGAATTLSMIFARLIGSGILSVITSGAGASSSVSQLQPNVGVMVQFISTYICICRLT